MNIKFSGYTGIYSYVFAKCTSFDNGNCNLRLIDILLSSLCGLYIFSSKFYFCRILSEKKTGKGNYNLRSIYKKGVNIIFESI